MPALDQAPEPSHGLMLLTPDSCPLPLSTLQDPDVCLHLPGSFLLLPWGSETQMPVEPGRQMAEADVMMREDQAKEGGVSFLRGWCCTRQTIVAKWESRLRGTQSPSNSSSNAQYGPWASHLTSLGFSFLICERG